MRCMMIRCTRFSESVVNYFNSWGEWRRRCREKRFIYTHHSQAIRTAWKTNSFLIKADSVVEVAQLVDYHVRQVTEPHWGVRDSGKPKHACTSTCYCASSMHDAEAKACMTVYQHDCCASLVLRQGTLAYSCLTFWIAASEFLRGRVL